MLDSELLAPWLERMRAVMLSNKRHHLAWRERRAFYEAVGTGEIAARFRGWLAILCAQRVLPIALAETPWDTDVLLKISAATHLLRGKDFPGIDDCVIDVRGEVFADWGYMSMEYNEVTQEGRHLNTLIARVAAFKAVEEAKGDLDCYQWVGHHYPDHSFRGGEPQKDADIKGTDEDWAILVAVGDAAGSAAVASACDMDSARCRPTDLKAFWLWWLDHAIPQALDLAGSGTAIHAN